MKTLLLFLLPLFISCNKDSIEASVERKAETRPPPLAPLSFSGYNWIVKYSGNAQWGPGPNYFATNNVSVDSVGYLHLKIAKLSGKWKCAEVSSVMNMGYGKYIYVTKGNIELYDKKIVVGLFTWDDNDYQTQANSELDIEFAKWGVANKTKVMQYSVQPTYGPGLFPERTSTPATNLIYDSNGLITHVIEWHSTYIKFEAHTGDDTTATTLTHSWIFNNTNPLRQALQGGIYSDPIIIPAPGLTTKAHINFWLIDKNGDGKGDAPSNAQPAEIIIKRFQYIAY